MATDGSLSLTTAHVRIAHSRCEEVANGLGLGDGFSWVTQFSPSQCNWLVTNKPTVNIAVKVTILEIEVKFIEGGGGGWRAASTAEQSSGIRNGYFPENPTINKITFYVSSFKTPKRTKTKDTCLNDITTFLKESMGKRKCINNSNMALISFLLVLVFV